MTGIDFLLAERPDDGVLHAAIVEAVGLPPDDVQVVRSVEAIREGVPVAVEVFPADGDFRALLSVYVTDPSGPDFGLATVARIARALGVRALVPDDSVDPYTMLLVRDEGDIRPVSLDVESLDSRGEYKLSCDAETGTNRPE